MSAETTIVLIGMNVEVCQILRSYLDRKFNIKTFPRHFDIKTLEQFDNIVLFIMDTDQFAISIENTIQSIKSQLKYQNIPILGTALKQHYGKIEMPYRNLFEDIVLTPMNYEDILIRIDVWINTYNHLRKSLTNANNIIAHSHEKLVEINPIEF